MATDQAAGQHAISSDGDAEFAAGRQNAVLDAARDERIFDLKVADGMDLGRLPDRIAADFGEADMAYEASLHQIGDGANRVLDRDLGIEPSRTINIDMIRLEALQRISEGRLHCGRP